MTPEQYKQLSIKEFSEAAKTYDTNHAGLYEMCKDDYPQMLAELEKEPFFDVLDVGCGTGAVIALLNDKYPGRRGLDARRQQRGRRCHCQKALAHLATSLLFTIRSDAHDAARSPPIGEEVTVRSVPRLV